MNTVAVTGGTGFLGSHLVEALSKEGQHVRALVRDPKKPRWLPTSRCEPVSGTLLDESAVRRLVSGVDVVYHCAAMTKARNDADMIRVNVAGTQNVLNACLAQETPPALVFVSSQAACGPSFDGRPVTEGTPTNPQSTYGRSKRDAERVLEAQEDRLRLAIVRPPAVYGPRDDAFYHLFKTAANGWLPRPPGARRLAIIHVEDAVSGTRLAGERGHGTYFLSDGVNHPLDDVLDAIARAIGSRVRHVPVPGALFTAGIWLWERAAALRDASPPLTTDRTREVLKEDWILDDTRARNELGYRERWTLDEGMQATAAWYREEGWL